MKTIQGAVLCAAVALAAPLHADFTYTETTQMTGGSMLGLMKMAGTFSRQARQAGEPIVSTVAIKGNRMAKISPDHTEIIDLDAETITNIDTLKQQYTVITFQQMKQQIEAAAAKAKQQQAKSDAKAPDQPSTTDVKFQVSVRNTSRTKDVSGLGTKEAILAMNMIATDKDSGQTGSMAITNDMWLVSDIPGYDEVKEFNRKFALKMGTVFSGAVNPAMLAQYRGAGQGMASMAEEMSKLKGTPVLQVMRMGMTDGTPLPAASEAPLPPPGSGPAMPTAGDVAQQSASSAIASKLGGFGLGGFGHKKKEDPPPADPSTNATAAQPTSSVLVETSTQLGGFSRTVNDTSFSVPAGFKQIQVKGVS
jgi:hypothetical protein